MCDENERKRNNDDHVKKWWKEELIRLYQKNGFDKLRDIVSTLTKAVSNKLIEAIRMVCHA